MVLEGKELAVRVQGTDKLEGTVIPLGGPSGISSAWPGSKTGPMGAVQVINYGNMGGPLRQLPALAATSAACCSTRTLPQALAKEIQNAHTLAQGLHRLLPWPGPSWPDPAPGLRAFAHRPPPPSADLGAPLR